MTQTKSIYDSLREIIYIENKNEIKDKIDLSNKEQYYFMEYTMFTKVEILTEKEMRMKKDNGINLEFIMEDDVSYDIYCKFNEIMALKYLKYSYEEIEKYITAKNYPFS